MATSKRRTRPRKKTPGKALTEYRRKRRFNKTPEPTGSSISAQPTGSSGAPGQRFVIQKHDATRLHYDFRLELDGVLKSWAVPKGPSLDPEVKRLAIQVEDHPVDYASFEGTIPEGEYGGGTVLVWDQGTWSSESSPNYGLNKGHLRFKLDGEKLRGLWDLVRIARGEAGKAQWLLRKARDEFARPESKGNILDDEPNSVISARSLDEIAAHPGSVWHSNKVKATDSGNGFRDRIAAAASKRSRRRTRGKPAPAFLQPQLATLVDGPPAGDDWLHEIKLDGYRILARVHKGSATLYTRAANNWTARFPTIVKALEASDLGESFLDGELVALTAEGKSSFQDLQNAFQSNKSNSLVYFVFDLLHDDGEDLTALSLEKRKEKLAAIFPESAAGPIRLCGHIEGKGAECFRQACKLGFEGIVSKRRDAVYRAGRSLDWQKSKCHQQEEFVIGGWDVSQEAQRGIRSLLLGRYDAKGRLIYSGRVGTGFDQATLKDLHARFSRLVRSDSPFPQQRNVRRKSTRWVEPKLVAQVRFAEWTRDGIIRSGSFLGLREDLPPEGVVQSPPPKKRSSRQRARPSTRPKKKRSSPKADSATEDRSTRARAKPQTKLTRRAHAGLANVRFTHPDKVLYAEQGLTKLQLAEYYTRVADLMLPHLAGRPLSLVRCPEGQRSTCFYQKHVGKGMPDTLETTPVEESNKIVHYSVVNDLKGLLSLVQIGVLEIHPWGSRADMLDRPDRLIIDLDPDPSVPWPRVVQAARLLRERLDDLGLTSFVKTTGGKGLHVVFPIARRTSWEDAKAFTKALAVAVVGDHPNEFTANMSKAARPNKIFVDYLRNARGATAVAAYSTRRTAQATVSVPLAWNELGNVIRSDQFTASNLQARLDSLAPDPWQDIDRVKQPITKAMLRKL